MGRPYCQTFFIFVLVSLCLLGISGCAQKASTNDYVKILKDKSLTVAQQRAKLDALQPGDTDMYKQLSIFLVVGGVILLAIGLITKRSAQPESVAGFAPAAPIADYVPHSSADDSRPRAPRTFATRAEPSAPSSSLFRSGGDRTQGAEEAAASLIPENQADVDAIPEDQRGVSYYTSRPMRLSELVEVTLSIGGAEHVVLATRDEAERSQTDQPPLVRAFIAGGRTQPWYEYEGYNPYTDYFAQEAIDWQGISNVGAWWMPAEKCDPVLGGFYAKPVPEDTAEATEDAADEQVSVAAENDENPSAKA